MLDKNSFLNNPHFVNMEIIIYIDEKWFYLTKKSERYYLVGDEEEPHRTYKSKKLCFEGDVFGCYNSTTT